MARLGVYEPVVALLRDGVRLAAVLAEARAVKPVRSRQRAVGIACGVSKGVVTMTLQSIGMRLTRDGLAPRVVDTSDRVPPGTRWKILTLWSATPPARKAAPSIPAARVGGAGA